MKAVLIAGGLGTRLSEETSTKPKPMVEIGGRPILWHIMKHYSFYGINDFIVCCGYKGYLVGILRKLFLHMSDVTIDIAGNSMGSSAECEVWKVTLIDTGEDAHCTAQNVYPINPIFSVYLRILRDFPNRPATILPRVMVLLSRLYNPSRYGALKLENPVRAFIETRWRRWLDCCGLFFLPNALTIFTVIGLEENTLPRLLIQINSWHGHLVFKPGYSKERNILDNSGRQVMHRMAWR